MHQVGLTKLDSRLEPPMVTAAIFAAVEIAALDFGLRVAIEKMY